MRVLWDRLCLRPISLVDPFLLSQNHLPPTLPKKTAGFSPNLKDASQTPGPGAYVVRRDFDKARSRAVFQSLRSTPPQRGPTALARHAPGSVPSKAQQPVALAQATMPTGRCCVMGFVNSGYEIGSVKWKQAPRICAPDSPRPDTHAIDLPHLSVNVHRHAQCCRRYRREPVRRCRLPDGLVLRLAADPQAAHGALRHAHGGQ